MNRQCAKCEFYDVFEQGMSSDFGDGECKRWPPTHMEKETGTVSILFMWPHVGAEYDWCGEFQASEGA